MVLRKVRTQGISQKNQLGFKQIMKLLMNLLIFLMITAFHEDNNHYVITNDQNWDPLLSSCSYLFDFGNPFPSPRHLKRDINIINISTE